MNKSSKKNLVYSSIKCYHCVDSKTGLYCDIHAKLFEKLINELIVNKKCKHCDKDCDDDKSLCCKKQLNHEKFIIKYEPELSFDTKLMTYVLKTKTKLNCNF